MHSTADQIQAFPLENTPPFFRKARKYIQPPPPPLSQSQLPKISAAQYHAIVGMLTDLDIQRRTLRCSFVCPLSHKTYRSQIFFPFRPKNRPPNTPQTPKHCAASHQANTEFWILKAFTRIAHRFTWSYGWRMYLDAKYHPALEPPLALSYPLHPITSTEDIKLLGRLIAIVAPLPNMPLWIRVWDALESFVGPGSHLLWNAYTHTQQTLDRSKPIPPLSWVDDSNPSVRFHIIACGQLALHTQRSYSIGHWHTLSSLSDIKCPHRGEAEKFLRGSALNAKLSQEKYRYARTLAADYVLHLAADAAWPYPYRFNRYCGTLRGPSLWCLPSQQRQNLQALADALGASKLLSKVLARRARAQTLHGLDIWQGHAERDRPKIKQACRRSRFLSGKKAPPR